MYTCPKSGCKTILKSKHEFLGHMDTHSATTSNRYYPCPHPQCSFSFKTRNSFYTHFKTHEDEPVKSEEVSCLHCNGQFTSIHELEKHFKTFESQDLRISCPFCKKSAKSYATFNGYAVHKSR